MFSTGLRDILLSITNNRKDKNMKVFHKKAISTALALSLSLLQIPFLPVVATEISMEKAYFQVMEDIVQEKGICTSINSSQLGLFYADLLDFDQDGQEELFLIQKTTEGFTEYNFFDFQYQIEVWTFENGTASPVIQDTIQLSDPYSHRIYRSTNGQYFISKSTQLFLGFHSDYSYMNQGSNTEFYVKSQWNQVDGLGYVEDSSGHLRENLTDEELSDYIVKKTDEFFPVSNASEVITIMDIREFVLNSDLDLYYNWQSLSLSAEEILSKIPYTGDLSKANLTSQQAIAMAEEIDRYYANHSIGTWVALFDSGTGVPAMWLLNSQQNQEAPHELKIYSDNNYNYSFNDDAHIYYWNNNQRKLEYYDNPELVKEKMFINITDDKTYISGNLTDNLSGTFVLRLFDFNGGNKGDLVNYAVHFMHYMDTDKGRDENKEMYQTYFNEVLAEHGLGPVSLNWDYIGISDEPEYFHHTLIGSVINGETVESDANTKINEAIHPGEEELTVWMEGNYRNANGNWADGKNTAALLRQYAEVTKFRFPFPEFSLDTDITKLFASLNLPGTMKECYQVTDHFYYVIMEENGTETGYLICAIKENGQIVYKIVNKSTELLEEDTLITEGNHYAHDSNIQIEFDAMKNFNTETEYVNYFTNALQNITGMQLNDNGKLELALSMQDSIVNFATLVKDLSDDTGEVRQEEISPLVEKSNSLYKEFVTLLREEQAELNKELEQTVRVVMQGLDEKNWTIYFHSDLIGQLDGNNLQVFLSSGQQGVEVSADDLEVLLKEYGGLFVNVQETGVDQYSISFADNEGNAIEKLDSFVKIFLPTSNEFATVMLEYSQGTENWGGQYNSQLNTIQFSTIYSGSYFIVDNSVEINDVSEENLSMIQFMVSKGFFEVDELGDFYPDGEISRNDFTKTLVSMFFALDRDLEASFEDVSPDSPYYSYIASGESREIIAGFDDGTFKGDTIITEEMVFALIAQTLVDKKGFIYPENLDFYLDTVEGSKNSNQWSELALALCIGSGIITVDESINPMMNISRENAAIYLYRLFMLLEEKQQVNFSLAEAVSLNTNEENNDLLIYGCILGGFLIFGAGAYLNLQQKKKD